jgi:acetolactate synthase-1/2/3 large subunit
VEWVAAALAESVPDDAIVLEEAVTSADAVRLHLQREEPGTLLNSGAPGLGWALGGAVGTKLARPERDVVALCGDGTFVFGSPVAALWASHTARAPFLAVVFNNAGYNASKRPVMGLFPRGASMAADQFPGVRFTEPPDYAALARSCHAYGEQVTEPERLIPALANGLAAIRNGQAAVIDVVLDAI